MPKKTLKVKKVSVNDGRVSMQNEDNNWYTHFGDDLRGKIYAGGEIKVSYEKSKKGKYTNRTIKKFKVIDPGKKPKGGSEGSGGSGFKVSYPNTKEGFDAKQDSITRQVALKEAVNLVAGKEKKATFKAILKDAEEFYNWLQEIKVKDNPKKDEDDEDKDDDDLDDDDSDEDEDDDDDSDDDDDDDDDDDFDDLDDDDED